MPKPNRRPSRKPSAFIEYALDIHAMTNELSLIATSAISTRLLNRRNNHDYNSKSTSRCVLGAVQLRPAPKLQSQLPQNDYSATVRCDWCDFVERMRRDGQISEALAIGLRFDPISNKEQS
jgi:hypothetical protein